MSRMAWLIGGVRAAGVAVLALLLLGVFDGTAAFGQSPMQVAQAGSIRDFDHLKTGFPLTGAHATQRCESCHIAGIFKGTPRDCASCHVAGTRFSRNNIVKTANHVQTQQPCDTCHNTSTYIGARFVHTGVRPGTCATCHNGAGATGKPPGHVPTTASCDSCHRSTAWRPAGFNHANVAPGTCATCHNGSAATGKPVGTHVPTTQSCDSCHTNTSTWLPVPATYTHTGVAPGSCTTCHGGAFANIDVKPPGHLPTTQQCDGCHRTSAWKPAVFDHTGVVAGSCATCHNGTSATGKPNTGHIATTQSCDACHTNTSTWLPVPATYAHTGIAPGTCSSCHGGTFTNIDIKKPNHITTTASCDTCHRTTAWLPSTFTHQSVAAGSCATCHNGTQATGKPTTGHIATTQSCDACHTNTNTWLPVPATYAHTGIAPGSCASCHGGTFTSIDVKPANHITTTASCDTCHRTTAWLPSTFTHQNVAAGSCATCHNGTQATGKPTTGHIPTTQACDACHTNTTTWLPVPATYGHAGVAAGTCTSCHGGSFTGIDVKSPTHLTTTLVCDSCHRTTAWTPASFDHTGVVAGTCATCHNGTQATGKPTTGHVPTTQSCDACHTNTTTWLPVPATYGHAGIAAGTCATCHGGSFTNIDVKSTTHLVTTLSCDSCHRTTAWTPANFSHTGVVAGTCLTCHNGTTATGKSSGHIPTTTSCDGCHSMTVFKPATMNHAVVAGTQCKTCHNGSYTTQGTTGALAKPSNHIPEATQLLNGAAMDCNACHSGTTVWTAEAMNHNNSQGNGSGWCKGCHQTGTSYLGTMRKMALNHRNRTPVPTDCSMSGCHRPLGNTGSTYRSWD
jgi:hypothetical protein